IKLRFVFWKINKKKTPAIIKKQNKKASTAANLTKELEFHDSELTFRAHVKANGTNQIAEIVLQPKDNVAKAFKAAIGDKRDILSVEWTHRYYVEDDEYIPFGEDIETFLKREIAKPIICWEDSPQLGYEILPNKYFYRYEPPMPAKELLAKFWELENEAEKGLSQLT